MGDVKPVDEYLATAGGENAPQPINIASRVVAHVAHRIPVFRWIGKRSEGKDKSSGILSDIATLAAQVAARNEELITEIGGEIVSNAVAGKKRQRGAVVVTEQPITHHDFGQASPVDVVPQPTQDGGN